MDGAKVENIEPGDQQEKKQKQRNYPMPKEINYYMLQNYGYEFYTAKIYSEKVKILNEIMQNLNLHGFTFNETEIERRLKNMKSHYRRKKEDMELGVIQKTDWEYYDLLHSIFTRIAKENENKTQQTLPLKPLYNQANDIPEAHQTKLQHNAIKLEKVENSPMSDESDEPIDMSAKRMKILEFNHIKEVVDQIPEKYLVPNSSIEKNAAINHVIENLKVVDQTRLALDEQRLKLEIRRNELDKLGYKLSDVLYKLTNS